MQTLLTDRNEALRKDDVTYLPTGESIPQWAGLSPVLFIYWRLTMTPTEQNDPMPFLVWDTCAIAEHQAKFLVETGEVADEDEGFALACADSDLYAFAWDDLTECLTETLKDINPDGYWHAEVENFGWRNQNGYADFEATDGRTLLSNILPNTDCTFKVFLDPDNTLRIQNFHHDAPTGNEWYTLKAVTEREFAEAA